MRVLDGSRATPAGDDTAPAAPGICPRCKVPFAWTTAEVLRHCAELAHGNAYRVLELSAERDLWERRLLDAERAAYARGYQDGRDDQAREDGRRWAAMPVRRVNGEPTFAELELLRWGPGGREHFGDPRPDDYKGGPR